MLLCDYSHLAGRASRGDFMVGDRGLGTCGALETFNREELKNGPRAAREMIELATPNV
jgi:hypothetical protein